MTHSSVATGIKLTTDFGARTGPINKFVVHHAATISLAASLNLYMPGGRLVSPSYAIKDNQCILVVDEDKRPKTSGSATIDGQAVTVEVCNDGGAPDWAISDASFHTLARLIADVATRYRFPIDDAHVIGHCEVYTRYKLGYATACPFVLQRRKSELLDLARHYAGQGAAPRPTQPTPAPAPAPTSGVNTASGWNPLAPCAVDGGFRKQTITKEQYQLGFRTREYLDGVNGPATIRRRQAKFGVRPQDGIELRGGPTIKAQQRHLGFTGKGVDGYRGPQTVTRLQQRMNAGTY